MFETIEELEVFLQNKVGITKMLVNEIKTKDKQISEMQKQIDKLSLTILNKAGESNA